MEPEWPAVDVIVGNPPFLGSSRIRSEFGQSTWKVWSPFMVIGFRRVTWCAIGLRRRGPNRAGKAKRVGLLATQAIRGGANRAVLERVKETGDIFWAQSDRNWVLEGATVHVSMVGFDDGSKTFSLLG